MALEKSFAGGNGTKSDPYIVNTAALLNEVRNYSGSYFIQTSNIDMSSISNWVPIGKDDAHPFYGHYDGNGYTISNLKIKNDGSEQYIGLFGYSGPEIKNLLVSYYHLRVVLILEVLMAQELLLPVLQEQLM